MDQEMSDKMSSKHDADCYLEIDQFNNVKISPFSAVVENDFGLDVEKQRFVDSDIAQKKFFISECIKTGITNFFDTSKDYLLSAKAYLGFDLDVCIGVWLFPDQDITKQYIDSVIKSVYNTNNNVKVALVLDSVLLYNEEQIATVVNYAKNNNICIYTNISQTLEEVGAYDKETGMSPIQYLESLGILDRKCILGGCSYLEKDDIDLLSLYDVMICVMPSKQMSNGECLPPVYSMLMRGLQICIGIDDNWLPDVFREIHLITCNQSSTLNIKDAINKDVLIKCFQNPIVSIDNNGKCDESFCEISIAKMLKFNNFDRIKIASCFEKENILKVVKNGIICYNLAKK